MEMVSSKTTGVGPVVAKLIAIEQTCTLPRESSRQLHGSVSNDFSQEIVNERVKSHSKLGRAAR